VLARSELCVQGFSATGVQFHPEVTLDQIRHWLAQGRRRQLSDVDGGIDQDLNASQRLEPQATAAAARPLQGVLRRLNRTRVGGAANPLVFSVGYIRMSQKVRSAGGFYRFVTAGLGKVTGLGTA
jgi:hypothetical protein